MRKVTLLFLLLFLSGCGLKFDKPSGGKVVASFDGVKVTDLDFIKKVQTLPQALQKVAMEDLEIRGAGNILGTEQHGYITHVGFDLYCRFLKETVHRLKQKP